MLVRGVEFLENLIEQGPFEAKIVFKEHGVLFFSARLQHRDQRAERISYEDDYKGNALAAMLPPGASRFAIIAISPNRAPRGSSPR